MTDKDLTGEELLTAIVNSWWQKLIDYLPEETIKKRQIKTSVYEYEWAGCHEEDARYTFPNREKLIDAVLMKILEEHKPQEVDGDAAWFIEFIEEGLAGGMAWASFCDNRDRLERIKQLLTQKAPKRVTRVKDEKETD